MSIQKGPERGKFDTAITGTDRVYMVPPERRGLFIDLRTSALRALHRLGLPNWKSGKQVEKAASVPVAELLERLKPYPVLQSEVLEGLPDREWEEYALGEIPAHQVTKPAWTSRLPVLGKFFR